MLPLRPFHDLILQDGEATDELTTRLLRQDDFIDEAALRGPVGVGEFVGVFGFFFGELGGGVVGGFNLAAEDDLTGAFGAHDGDLSAGPGVVKVSADVLGVHYVVSAAIGLAGDDGDAGHGGFAQCVEQLSAVGDDAAPFLIGAGQEARNIDEDEQGNVEAITGTGKAGGFFAGFYVQHPGQTHRLISDDTDALARQAGEADDDVVGVVFVDLEEGLVVDDTPDDIPHVVGLVRTFGHDAFELLPDLFAQLIGQGRGFFAVILRQVAQQGFDFVEADDIVSCREVGDARLRGVSAGTTEFFAGDFLVGHGFDYVRAGDKHIAAAFDHDGKIGHRRAVHRATGAGPHDGRELGDDAAGLHVAVENVGVATKRTNAFLDAGAAAIVEADEGCTGLDGHVHHLADLLGVGLREGTAEDGEVLGKDIHQAATDGAVAGHYAISVEELVLHAEVGGSVGNQRANFFKATGVKQ